MQSMENKLEILKINGTVQDELKKGQEKKVLPPPPNPAKIIKNEEKFKESSGNARKDLIDELKKYFGKRSGKSSNNNK